ncbi:hypothetical protein EPO15_05665 [bacterium]|nr:MAG: hypothetical protein EPO15_05665 [bacterium]
MKKKTTRSPGAVTETFKVAEHGLEPILGAAYLLTDRAYARVDGDRAKSLTVTLVCKAPGAAALKALREAFELELATQKVRWAMAKNNVGVREYVARQAVLFASGHALAPAPQAAPNAQAAPAAEPLSADQQAEIDRLIAEVETEIKELKNRPAGADPDNVKATWEEKHGEAS